MAETTPSSARVDRAVAPTAEEAKAANAGEYTPRGANRFLYDLSRNWAVRLGLMGVAGVAAYQNVPAIQEFVDSKLFNAGESASNPDVFDPEQEIIDLTRQNTTAISPEEIGNFTKIESPDFDTMETFTLPSDPNLPRYRSREPVLQIPLPFEVPDNSRVILRYVESFLGFGNGYTGVKDKITVNGLPKDTVVYAPFSGEFHFVQTSDQGTSNIASLAFKDDKGTYRNLIFQFGVSDSLISEAEAPKTKSGNFTWKQETYVEAGTPLFKLDETNAKGNFLPNQLAMNISPGAFNEKGVVFSEKGKGKVAENDGKPLYIFTPLAIATADNKAIVIENK